MVTTIKVVVKFDQEPSTEYLDNYVDNMMELVDDYCNHRPRSFHIEPPKPEQLATRDFVYRWVIDVCDASAHAEELFKMIEDITSVGKLLLVNVLDHEYDIAHKANVGYYWTNDGETWYHDSEQPYVDASVMNETAKSQFNMSKLDYAIQSINKEIVDYANRGLTEVTMYVGGCHLHFLTHMFIRGEEKFDGSIQSIRC